MNMKNIPRPEHPDPQWERKNWQSLNGEWQFEIDHGVSGFHHVKPLAAINRRKAAVED